MFPERNDGEFFNTREVVDFFEKRGDQEVMPNLILFEVEENEQTYVIGGYSSHSWSPATTGDATSFIFNLTDNLRFNAIEKLAGDFFTKTEDINDYDDESEDNHQNNDSQEFNTWES